MSSHPGSTLQDAVALAEYLQKRGRQPEQVQDFYPTPGTISTCMYYTGLDPRTMEPVYVAKTFHEKAMQRALLQWKRPDKRRLVIEALHEAGREDLIGYGKNCLVRPDAPRKSSGGQNRNNGGGKKNPQANQKQASNNKKSPQGRGKPAKSGKPAPTSRRDRGRR
jgi:2,4-dienoyl-CoA reductase-like NADH-dependent reductase (Old Yellow Enzyme family)